MNTPSRPDNALPRPPSAWRQVYGRGRGLLAVGVFGVLPIVGSPDRPIAWIVAFGLAAAVLLAPGIMRWIRRLAG